MLPPPPNLSARKEIRIYHRSYKDRNLWHVDLLSMFTWGFVAISVGLYLIPYGLKNFADNPADLFKNIGILAGLVGTSLILLMVVLASRIPLLEKIIGQPELIRLHKKIGKPAFYLIITHLIFLTIGLSLIDKTNFITETFSLLQTKDMVLAYLSFFLITTVIITSLVVVFRKLPYEGWHFIHLFTYVAVLIAIPHQLSMSEIFQPGSLAKTYWVTLYVVVFTLAFIYRFLTPTIQSIRYNLTVGDIEKASKDTFILTLVGNNLSRMKPIGGQYVNLRFLTAGTWWHAHPFSFSQTPTDNTIRVTFRAIGKGTQQLTRLSKGTKIMIEGPYGLFTQRVQTKQNLIFICAGIGITPVLSYIQEADLRDKNTTVIIRASNAGDFHHHDELQYIASHKNIKVYTSAGPRNKTQPTWVSNEWEQAHISLGNFIQNPKNTDIFICGPEQWMLSVRKDAITNEIPAQHIHMERFT